VSGRLQAERVIQFLKMKFGIEQQIWKSLAVKFLKIQDGGRPSYCKMLEML